MKVSTILMDSPWEIDDWIIYFLYTQNLISIVKSIGYEQIKKWHKLEDAKDVKNDINK